MAHSLECEKSARDKVVHNFVHKSKHKDVSVGTFK